MQVVRTHDSHVRLHRAALALPFTCRLLLWRRQGSGMHVGWDSQLVPLMYISGLMRVCNYRSPGRLAGRPGLAALRASYSPKDVDCFTSNV